MTLPSAPAASPAQEPTHGCVRCGAPVPISESMCERCNPLGLKSPAASQAHGIAIVGVGVAVVILAVVARLVIADVGPFSGSVTGVVPDPDGLKVTIAVTNDGLVRGLGDVPDRRPGPGRDRAGRGVRPEPAGPGRGSATFDVVVGPFGDTPIPLTADCTR